MQQPQTIPELPTLDAEMYRLNTDQNTQSILASLVVDHALLNEGAVYWIDSLDYAATDPITAVAPSTRILDRIHVARGFTPYQHFSIAETLLCQVESDPPSLIVAPAIDGLYREVTAGIDAAELLAQAVARLAAIRRRYNCPVLLTVARDDAVSHPVVSAVTAELNCEHTVNGPRFVGDEFETLVYPIGHGLVQTTIAYWQSVIDARQPLYAVDGELSPERRATA